MTSVIKPSLVLANYKTKMAAITADKMATMAAIEAEKAKLVDALPFEVKEGQIFVIKPTNYEHAPIIRKLLNITRAVSLSNNETDALSAIGVQCEGAKLTKTVRENLAKVAKPFLELCDKYESEASKVAETIAHFELRLSNIADSEIIAATVRDNALSSFFKATALDIANAFKVERPCGRYVAELVNFVSSLKASREDNERLEEFEGSLIDLAACDSSKSPSAEKSYLSGLGLANLSAFIGGLGCPVAAPVTVPDVSAGYDDGTPKPPVLAAKKKWQEFAREYSGELHNRDTIADKAFSRLLALGKRVALHAQKGTLSSIRVAEKSGIVSGRTDQIILGTIGQMHKILQGGINLGVRLAVETSGKDLSVLNRVTNCPLIWTKSTGFSLADFKTYIEDCLPHLEFKKGTWQLRSKKALENRKLGSFGIYIFGQLPACLVCDKPPVFPLLDWLQFRELKKQFSREAAAANKAAKAEYENAWLEYEESFPLDKQLETLESTLAAIDAERAAVVEKAAKLKAALQ